MALPLLALGTIPALFSGVVAAIVRFYLASKFAQFAAVLAGITTIIAIYIAFVVAAYTTLALVKVTMPPEFYFAFGLIPPSAPAMLSAYMTVLVSRRVYDWTQIIYEKTTHKSFYNYL